MEFLDDGILPVHRSSGLAQGDARFHGGEQSGGAFVPERFVQCDGFLAQRLRQEFALGVGLQETQDTGGLRLEVLEVVTETGMGITDLIAL